MFFKTCFFLAGRNPVPLADDARGDGGAAAVDAAPDCFAHHSERGPDGSRVLDNSWALQAEKPHVLVRFTCDLG